MTVEILGRRVHDDIGTKGERTAEPAWPPCFDGGAGAAYAPAGWAEMSTSFQSGLLGVSTHSSFVWPG